MKICTFCGCKLDNNTRVCSSCGGNSFKYVCLNCNEEFDGLYCPSCGTRFDAVEKVCPNCSTRYFSDACPKCGNIIGNPYSYRTRYGRQSMATAALMLSIFGIVFFGMGWIFSIISLVMASRVNKSVPSDVKLAKTAKIISIVGLALNVLVVVFYVAVYIYGLLSGHIK